MGKGYGEQIMDSRDLEERIKELEGEEEPDEDDSKELKALLELREECQSSGWEYGIDFIADSYFQEYAEQLAEDIDAISDTVQWPNSCIDWERAARALQQDYSSVEFMDEAYWWREAMNRTEGK